MARRAWRYGLLGLGTVVVLAVAAGAVLFARFDPNSLKPRIEAAVRQATGRELALFGPVSLKLSLWPTLALRDVTFANPPGYTRPQMATVEGLELQLAVLPLLRNRIEIARLVLVHPDILLEVDPQGRSNWRFGPMTSATQPNAGQTPGTGKPAGTGGGAGSTVISIHDVRIEDGTVAWRDDRSGSTRSLAVKQLTAKSVSSDAPLTLAAEVGYGGVALTLDGEVGPLARLQQPDADTPWPVKLNFAGAGGRIAVDGALTHPLQGRGYTLALDGTIADLAAMAPLLPGLRLPPLHDVHLASKISDSGGPVPSVEAMTLHLGAADLGAYVAGLRLVAVDLQAPQRDQPVRLIAQATMADMPLGLDATIGIPSALLPGQPSAPGSVPPGTVPPGTVPVPVDLTLTAANASLSIKGAVAHPETLSGADLALDAKIPDLSLLSPLAHRALPTVTQVAFRGQLTDAPGGFRHGAMLHAMQLTSADGDVSGDIGVNAGPPLALTGKLHAERIDADALLAAVGRPVGTSPDADAGTPATVKGEPSSGGTDAASSAGPGGAAGAGSAGAVAGGSSGGGAGGPANGGANGAAAGDTHLPPAGGTGVPPPRGNGTAASPTGGGEPGAAIATAPSASPTGAGRLTYDTPIPFGLLHQANADLGVTIGDLRTGGADYRSIDLHVALQDGKLRVAPLAADLPQGRLDATLDVDSTTTAPPLALVLHAPGLEVAPLFAAAGLPGYASGKLEVDADLHGAGDTPHAIAAGLEGSLGLAMQNGTIDTQLLDRWLGRVLRQAHLPGVLAHGGSSDLRCFALRADVTHGVAELRALDLNSSVLSMDGAGSVNLGDETLDLHLRPQGRLGGTVIVVPLRVSGPIRAPNVVVNALGTAESNVGSVAGAVIGSATPLGLLGGMLGGGKLLDGGSGDSCAGPLAIARGQAAPAAAAPSPQPQPQPQPKPRRPDAGSLLHDLFH